MNCGKLLISGLLLVSLTSFAQQVGKNDLDQFRQSLTQSGSLPTDSVLSLLKALDSSASIEEKKAAGLLAANYFSDQALFQPADSLYTLLLPWFRENGPLYSLLQAYSGMGNILQITGQLKEGIVLMDEAQSFINQNEATLTEAPEKAEIGQIYRTTGILYAMQMGLDEEGQFNQKTAENYFRKSYKLFLEAENHEMVGLALFNLGNVQAIEDSTLHYWQQALNIFETHGIESGKTNIYQNLAILHIDKGEFETALEYLEQVGQQLSGDSNPYDLSLYKVKLGRAHLGLAHFEEAIAHLNEALDLAIQYEMLSIEGEAYELLIDAYTAKGSYREALDTYVKYDTLVRRFEKSETERIFRETEARYKTREQQDQIDLLEQKEALSQAQIRQQQLVIAITIVLVLAIGAISYFLWKRARERRIINQKLQQLDEARTRFLVNIAHELRTPVALIHGPLDDAREQLESGNTDRVRKDLTQIANNTKKLVRLTEDVLHISRLDDGDLHLETRPTLLKDFLNKTFYAFESLAVRNDIRWMEDISLSNENFLVDPNKLELILNNLLSNAIKHTPSGGKVHFTASMDGHSLKMQIADTGKGIHEEALPQIFERYFQATEQDRVQGGLGVGLSLVKELVELMKGRIDVHSSQGKGTTFLLSIPLEVTESSAHYFHDESIDKPAAVKQPKMDLSGRDMPHILVVEDNVEMADFIQQLLSDHYKVTVASNGKQGIERLQSGNFDLITADVMMPEMDGMSFIKRVKSHSDWSNLSVIMITALAEETDRLEGLKLGIDDYITKPFSANELRVRVDNLIRNAQARREAEEEKPDEPVDNEQKLLQGARAKVEAELSNNSFSVKDLADHINLSERQANRVLKKLTGLSCLQFIREIRLQKAYRLLESRKYATIAEVVNAVGFENSSYFTRLFAERFGKKPSELSS